jgi:hypothetical protein
MIFKVLLGRENLKLLIVLNYDVTFKCARCVHFNWDSKSFVTLPKP